MQECPFSEPTSQDPNLPFSAVLRDLAGVLYHGTSSPYEAAIDANGLQPRTSAFALFELQAILAIFSSLEWYGITLASRAVLEPFSIQHDFGGKSGKPIYLAEACHRACTFASRNFAGGEIAMTVRSCFRELHAYAADADIRADHRDQLLREASGLQQLGVAPRPLPSVDVDKLREQLAELADVEARAEALLRSTTHGLIYAIAFDESDLHNLVWHKSMGVKCHSSVPPNKILAKSRVPLDYECDPYLQYDVLGVPSVGGILKRLS